jgi:hypothetical protein
MIRAMRRPEDRYEGQRCVTYRGLKLWLPSHVWDLRLSRQFLQPETRDRTAIHCYQAAFTQAVKALVAREELYVHATEVPVVRVEGVWYGWTAAEIADWTAVPLWLNCQAARENYGTRYLHTRFVSRPQKT